LSLDPRAILDLDQLDVCFDDTHAVANAGLLLPATLAERLGIEQIAELVGVSTGTVHYWITTGFLAGRRGPASRWCVPFPHPRSSTPAGSAPPARPTSTPTAMAAIRAKIREATDGATSACRSRRW
jgi:hypothetical protein